MFMPHYSPALFPIDEVDRQRAVDRSGLAGGRFDPRLQGIVEDAVLFYHTPFAAITVIDRDRQRLLARVGLEITETSRDIAFCAHAIHRPGEPMVVLNAATEPRFMGYPTVLFAPHVRFYAGMPFVDRQGYPLGALCVFDYKPRSEDIDMTNLMLLTRQVERIVAQ